MDSLFVEILMSDWSRIPFTCSYIPGKRIRAADPVLIAFVAFTLFSLDRLRCDRHG